MIPNHLKLGLVLALCVGHASFASDCAAPGREVHFSHGQAKVMLSSPDHQWEFISEGSETWEDGARLVMLDYKTNEQWNIGSLDRNGTVFWSQDSEWLILRDEYAADDTRLRVFDLMNSGPQELHGIDHSIKGVISVHTPPNEESLWVTYPEVCFSDGSSSIIRLTVDAPHAPKNGVKGKSFQLRLIIDLTTASVHEYKDRWR